MNSPATLAQALAPALSAAKAALNDFAVQVVVLGPMLSRNASLNALEGGRGRVDGSGNTFSCPTPTNGLHGPKKSPPPELMRFLMARSNREAATELGLALGTVYRLKSGYWPADSRKIMRAWDGFMGHFAKRSTSWFLRRVSAEGLRHGGNLYEAPQLASRVGELLAIARAADGGLVAQTLEVPIVRFTLAVKG